MIPVFNEETVIADVLAHVLRTFPNVVCVDDGSRDGSAARILGTGAHLLRHPINLGQGAALQTGLSYALARPGAEYFVTFDADGQHQVEDVEAMIAVLRTKEADVTLGSRFLESAHEVPLLKKLVLKTIATLSGSSRRLGLTDTHNGLRAFNRAVAEKVDISQAGMAHASELVDFLARSSFRVREVPVTIKYTEYSMSKGQSLLNGVNIMFDLALRRRG
ncbi:glycosyltransferase family 2 protein [Actinospica sp.]|uniref:glycosyltransferase family 2 protein n=1 Tax=Actinospica sp. TaxID=1872142 RepID=UPI002CEEA6CE|nr:glycosyltransferase family 2 protein [Actinospica sp.]HWG25427.1 glycosyltransferase family 2 protein [Actinospica sp.]